MEMFVFRHGDYARLYNCSAAMVSNIDAVPLEQRRQPAASILIIALCALCYILYAPCFYSILRQMRSNSCYQILCYIAVANLCILWILGFLHGWLGLEGAVFCSHPSLIYITGCLSALFWMAESTAGILLAAARCLEIAAPRLAERLFKGRRVWLWLFGISLYASYRFMFTPPCLFNAIYFQWLFNPFRGYSYWEDREDVFSNKMAYYHDIGVAILLPLLYTIFVCVISYKYRAHHHSSIDGQGVAVRQISRTEKIITLQVFLIAFTNSFGCTLFVVVQHIDFGIFFINYVDHFVWFFTHGIPPVLYLTLNRSIRTDCRLLFDQLLCRKREENSTNAQQQQQQLHQERTQVVQVVYVQPQQLQQQTSRPPSSAISQRI